MNLSPHILVVDADADARRSIADYLGEFDFRVSGAADSNAMHNILARDAADLILIDIKSPAEDGIALIRELRAGSSVPIIVLGSRKDDVDRIMGLELGADDYLTKPFNPRELVARIRTLLRRARSHPVPDEALRALRFAQWELNVRTGRLISNAGRTVQLTPSELALLRVLLDAPEQILSREQLLESVRQQDGTVLDRRIDVQILRLRRKIESDPARPRLIRTERGLGYFFDAEVHRIS